ncbi:DinB family protein [Mucilaginibacter sp. PAMB04274]|uniref:DinB family protein n=1 Tax=Mucilaginibacter sp. PAMB04274 TaxID=3138568 RepID=UPI0031F6ADDA
MPIALYHIFNDMIAQAISEYEETTQQLLRLLSKFTPAQFNQVPFEGSWTAGQLAEHVLKSQSSIGELFGGSARPANRKPDENGKKSGVRFWILPSRCNRRSLWCLLMGQKIRIRFCSNWKQPAVR